MDEDFLGRRYDLHTFAVVNGRMADIPPLVMEMNTLK